MYRSAVFLLMLSLPCVASDKAAGPCFKVRGRLSYYNGTPSTRIWIVGTHRMLSLPSEDSELPPNVKILLKDFDDNIFADYTVCPLEKYTKGEMQAVVVRSATRVVNRRSNF